MALNILVVDDSQIVRAVIAKSLEVAGVPVRMLHQASNGAEALQILVSHSVDLVLADINMPVMGGVEMVERMSRDDHLWSIPVVIVSTEGSATRMEELQSKGVRAYLRKPFRPESIRAVVEEVIGAPHANG
jgi:two-component system chemotaxis response regulator CheY